MARRLAAWPATSAASAAVAAPATAPAAAAAVSPAADGAGAGRDGPVGASRPRGQAVAQERRERLALLHGGHDRGVAAARRPADRLGR